MKSVLVTSRMYALTSRVEPAHGIVDDILEQFLAGQLLAAGDRAGHPPVVEDDVVRFARLPGESEMQGGGTNVDVVVAKRCYPVGIVGTGVFVVADSDQRVVEQPNGGGDNTLERQLVLPHVGLDSFPEIRKCVAEADERLELRFVPGALPIVVVAILLAIAGIAPGCLDVSPRVDAEPNVGPGGRNDETPESIEGVGVADRSPAVVEVHEARVRGADVCNRARRRRHSEALRR